MHEIKSSWNLLGLRFCQIRIEHLREKTPWFYILYFQFKDALGGGGNLRHGEFVIVMLFFSLVVFVWFGWLFVFPDEVINLIILSLFLDCLLHFFKITLLAFKKPCHALPYHVVHISTAIMLS